MLNPSLRVILSPLPPVMLSLSKHLTLFELRLVALRQTLRRAQNDMR